MSGGLIPVDPIGVWDLAAAAAIALSFIVLVRLSAFDRPGHR